MMTQFVLVPRVICSNGSSEQESETIGFGQENRCLFRQFQINIPVKISIGLLRTELVRKPRRKVCQRSIKWFERDISAMDEVEFRRNCRLSRAAGHSSTTAAGVSRS